MKIKRLVVSSLFLALLLTGCGSKKEENQSTVKDNNINIESKNDNTVDQKLDQLEYKSGDQSYIEINNNKSNLKTTDWKYNHVVYADLDNLNRTSTGNIAYLEHRNLASGSLRSSQTVQPTAWHQKFVDGSAIINRGHEIAYSISGGISLDGSYKPGLKSGDQNNIKNLFTQSAFSNQKVQTIYETKVRDALKEGKKVIYKVTPIFKGNNLMASGVHMQALSTDETLNFNIYLYNVQPGVKFDYATGRSKIDKSMTVPTPQGAPNFSNNNRSYKNNHHYARNYGSYNTHNYHRSYHHYNR
ncbi:DNA/RNA non-specific endonuclease [Apilactobacillus apisilvae]|uniref:DNA/RNA non-specific endonuclease n=1 Tax=Apilactobacillus apisilvae TaxID=2923364 RepID=A0ABY4PGP2_9LACO|nr:DNA/RNA non-specific endonuclease [Apilactobacillus apisilvae]UQS84914.1 DNA/RNA non-specific endonuclease [Apilactobacillus apisilvae]